MRSSVIDSATVSRYLRRLGFDDPGEPSLTALCALHRAHTELIPYEVLEIQLGRPTDADPATAIRQILHGRGGYCVQLNGAFATLLAALGYQVTWHGAQVQAGASQPDADKPSAPHLAPTVELEGQTWFVDVGLGDGLHDPLPLREGEYRQGPFTFRLRPSELYPGGWRFDHDPRGAIVGLDFTLATATVSDFTKWHPYLASSQESRLVRTVAVMRRDAAGADSLVGCVLKRLDSTGTTRRIVEHRDEWFSVLTEQFGLALADVDEQARTALWNRVRTSHERWLAARAARSA